MKKKMNLMGFDADVEYRVLDGEVEVSHIYNIKGGNSVIIESMGLIDIAKNILEKELKNGNAN